MKLSNFKQEVDEVILKRGYDYYKEGHVLGKRCVHEGHYEVLVVGHENYKVNVWLDSNGTLLSYHCNCPFKGGPICKHEVAAFYALSISFKPKESELVQLLKTLPVETLVHELAEVAGYDVNVYQHLMTYQKHSDLLAQFELELEAIVAKHLHFGHIIFGKAIERLTNDLSVLMMKIDQLPDSHMMLLKCEMALLLREECAGMDEQLDDTNAVFTDFLGELHALLQSLVFQALDDECAAHDVFDFLMTKLSSTTDIDFELLDLIFEYGRHPKYLSLIMNYLKEKVDVVDETMKSSLYQCWYELLVRYSEEEAIHFLDQYHQIKGLQIYRLEQLIQKEAYDEALLLVLTLESLEGYQYDLSLKETRYLIYEKLNQVEDMKQLAEALFLEGHVSYYDVLKNLYHESFATFYESLKNRLKSTNDSSIYLKLIEFENDKEAMVEYIREHLSTIEVYAKLLFDGYPLEVCELYEQYICEETKQAMNRVAYRRICLILRRFGAYTTLNQLESFIHSLIQMFPRRRALKEELHQLLQELKGENKEVEIEQLSIEIA